MSDLHRTAVCVADPQYVVANEPVDVETASTARQSPGPGRSAILLRLHPFDADGVLPSSKSGKSTSASFLRSESASAAIAAQCTQSETCSSSFAVCRGASAPRV